MLTVRGLLAEPGLGLRAVAGLAGLDRPLASAHVSEVPDPAPWLQGGELMMTTGMLLSPEHAEGYLGRIAEAGASALALGLGAELAFQQAPQWLAEAADHCGLPLLEVPQQTPFIAVTKAVFARLAEDQYAELAKAHDAQRALTAAAARGGGPAPLLTALARSTERWVVVTDPLGHPLVAEPAAAAERAGLIDPELERLRAAGLRGGAVVSGPEGEVRAMPLGVDRLLGFLLVGGPSAPGTYERALAATAACLLSLDAERTAAAGRLAREARGAALRRLVTEELSAELADGLLRAARGGAGAEAGGPSGRRLRIGALHVEGAAGDRAPLLDRIALVAPGIAAFDLADLGPRSGGGSAGEPVAAVLLPEEGDVESALPLGELGDIRVGVSAAVRPEEGPAALRQARYALGVGRRTGTRVTDAAGAGSSGLLLSLGGPTVLAGFASAVLDPLEDILDGGQTLPTLRAFLDANGAWEAAAADLGVHRHTLRHRIRRIAQASGRDLESATERMDLALAFLARDLAGE
ncbi:PucR family transcriptional regulator [Streptacidiphilus sp. MAP5-3]|uniref:PucR family transcriptional regulator n=1 Tax=unclassified Streptacidiphilus TaxID=2643834 RepID=UPI00351866A7